MARVDIDVSANVKWADPKAVEALQEIGSIAKEMEDCLGKLGEYGLRLRRAVEYLNVNVAVDYEQQ